MTNDQKAQCHKIIHAAAASGAGVAAAMAQVPGADNAVLIGIETTMAITLGAVFKVKLSRAAAAAMVAGGAATIAGRGISQFLVFWIPGVGNAVNAATAAAMIEAVGWAMAADFANKDNA